MLFDAMIYSLFLSCLTSVRTSFAILHQLVTPITIDIDIIFDAPRIACRKIIIKSDGMLRIISVIRIIIVSIKSEAIPLIEP